MTSLVKEFAGFQALPDYFFINEYQIDQDHWNEGFVTEQYEPLFAVCRQDDNGIIYLVKDRLTEIDAFNLVREYVSKGHKQSYWVVQYRLHTEPAKNAGPVSHTRKHRTPQLDTTILYYIGDDSYLNHKRAERGLMNFDPDFTHLDKVAIFVGAGASIAPPSCLPSFVTLRDTIIESLLAGYMSSNRPKELPSATNKLNLRNTKPELLFQCIRQYQPSLNPIEDFSQIAPNANHYAIADLCTKGVKIIVTTNFDHGIEKALNARGVHFKVFPGTPTDESACRRIISAVDTNATLIWKPHGDCAFPETLCFSMEEVGRLASSVYLRIVFEYILERCHLLTVGYSGYDDDFFIILKQWPKRVSSPNKLIWNSYQKPDNNSPPRILQTAWGPVRFFIWAGDMLDLFKQMLPHVNDVTHESSEFQFSWKKSVASAIESLPEVVRVAIMAQYLHRLNIPDSQILWRYGLAIPNISNRFKIAFTLNLTKRSDLEAMESAYEQANLMGFHNIAEVALSRLVYSYLAIHNNAEARKTLKRYYANLDKSPSYRLSDYYMLCADFLNDVYGDTKTANHAALRFRESAAEDNLKSGRFIEYAEAVAKIASGLAVDSNVEENALERLSHGLNFIENYNIPITLAEYYHGLCNIATRLQEKSFITRKDVAKYAQKTEDYLEICYELGIYTADKYNELHSGILHQRSWGAETPQGAIELINQAIECVNAVQDWHGLGLNRDYYLGFLRSSLAKNFMKLEDYDSAYTHCLQSLEHCRNCDDQRQVGRVLLDMATIEYIRGDRAQAVRSLSESYYLLKMSGQNLSTITEIMESIGISVSDLVKVEKSRYARPEINENTSLAHIRYRGIIA